MLRRLQERLDPAELRRLGRPWELIRRVFPTRPHPPVSRRPPGNGVAGARGDGGQRGPAGLAGPVDQPPPARGDRPPTSR